MKKVLFGVVAVVVLALFAEEVVLDWVFSGYFENIAVSQTEVGGTVDASLDATAEAELDISSFPCGTTLFFR